MSYQINNYLPGSTVLWNGVYPCSLCGCKLHSQFEFKAKAYVCAGCYNEFALEKGWETA